MEQTRKIATFQNLKKSVRGRGREVWDDHLVILLLGPNYTYHKKSYFTNLSQMADILVRIMSMVQASFNTKVSKKNLKK